MGQGAVACKEGPLTARTWVLQAFDADDQDLAWGVARSQDGQESSWLTFVLIPMPRTSFAC
jgi:hypothetical protein